MTDWQVSFSGSSYFLRSMTVFIYIHPASAASIKCWVYSWTNPTGRFLSSTKERGHRPSTPLFVQHLEPP